ncbi:MAG: nucleoside deaminase [Candidatus Omnitrophica bacterium]|nr:nucleoside deaminase [Candidatus Omnitrophota bacterium]
MAKLLDEQFMREALREATKALEAGELPSGAVIVHAGKMIGRAHTQVRLLKDPTAHAVMIALTQAATALESPLLRKTVLYATIEPCAMCVGAMLAAQVDHLIFGTPDARHGACGSVVNLAGNERLNRRLEITRGVLAKECEEVLQDYVDGHKR